MTNEKRLIDANALEHKMFYVEEKQGGHGWVIALEDLSKAPTVDAVEVVHGRWIHPKGYVVSNGFLCSVCGHEETSYHVINPRHGCCIADEHGNFYHPPKINYCPNCGAKMDLKGEHNEI